MHSVVLGQIPGFFSYKNVFGVCLVAILVCTYMALLVSLFGVLG